MRRFLFAAILAYGLALPALGQQPVVTQPFGVTTTQATGTITAGGTFQTLFAASAGRKGCLIQNVSANTMYVFVGTAAAASTTNSFQVSPSGTFNCALTNGLVVTDLIQITTSTTGDRYVATVQ